MFKVTQINWPWQGIEEVVLKPVDKKSELVEVKLLLKGKATGKTKVDDKIGIEVKPG